MKILLEKGMVALLLLSMMISAFSVTAFGDASGDRFNDDIDLFKELNILDEKVILKPDVEVSRGQVAQLLLNLLGFTDISGTDGVFSDVTSENPYKDYITVACDMKILSGFGDSTFRPDEKVSYIQLLKMVVSLLGYSENAESNGGFPLGYLQQASTLKITVPGISDGDAPLKFADIIRIFRESIEVDINKQMHYGTVSSKYDVIRGKNILSEYFSIYKYKGIINANYYTNISGNTHLNYNQVELNGEVFDKGTTKADEYLGQKVTAYVYKENDADEGVIVVVKPDSRCTVTVIAVDDIVSNYSDGKIVYEDSEQKNSTMNIPDDAIVVVNGKKVEKPYDNYFNPSMGSIKATDPDGRGYSVFFVDSYENHIIDAVDKEKGILHFKDTNETLVIDNNSSSVKTTFTDQNGVEAYVEDCIEWDVVSVFQSEDKSVLKVIRSDKIITGNVDGISEDTVAIDGIEYRIAKSLLNSSTLTKPYMGMKADFLLDYTGKITFANTVSYRDSHYGYVVRIASAKGVDKTVSIKMFTEFGEMKAFNISSNIEFNGVNVKSSTLMDNSLLFQNGSFVEQPVTFQTNDSDEIKVLNTALDGTKISETEKKEKFSLDYAGENEKMIGYDTIMFDTRYLPRAETRIFMVPNKYDGNDKNYRIIPYTGLRHYSEEVYKVVKFYDITEDNVISMMVLQDASADEISISSETAIVKKRSKGLNEDGENVNLITLYNSKGSDVKVYGDDDFEVLAGNTTITDLRTETQVDITENNDVPGNLLQNGGFEAADQSGKEAIWVPWPTTTLLADETIKKSGKKSLKMQYSANLTATQKVSIKGGEEYELSYWFYPDSGSNAYCAVKLQFYTAEGYKTQYDYQANHNGAPRDVWTQNKIVFTAKSDVIAVDVTFRLYNAGTVHFDDALLRSTKWQPPEGGTSPVLIKTFKDKIPLSAIEPGDVVQYEAMGTGEIKAMKVLFRSNAVLAETVKPKERANYPTSAIWDYNDLLYIYANVYARTKYGVKVFVPYGNDDANPLAERIHLFNKAKVILFNKDSRTKEPFKIISSRDIVEGDKVFALRNSSTQRFIIIYR